MNKREILAYTHEMLNHPLRIRGSKVTYDKAEIKKFLHMLESMAEAEGMDVLTPTEGVGSMSLQKRKYPPLV